MIPLGKHFSTSSPAYETRVTTRQSFRLSKTKNAIYARALFFAVQPGWFLYTPACAGEQMVD
jgi:hypothetical protein